MLRRCELDIVELYRPDGLYRRVHWAGVAALALGVAPNVPGFLGAVKRWDPPAFFVAIYPYAWFIGFAVGFAAYLLLARRPARAGAVTA